MLCSLCPKEGEELAMPKKTALIRWIAKRAQEDDDLYQRYGRGLEPLHKGEYVAISQDGQLITGNDELTVAKQAVQQFGPGVFALRRVGEEAEIMNTCWACQSSITSG